MAKAGSLALLALTILAATTVSSVDAQFVYSPGTTLRLCYLYFGNLDDLGWTFTFNIGRLRTQDQLQAAFPDIKIESVYQPNVFFGVENKTQNIARHVQDGCHVILANNAQLLGGPAADDWAARTFPNVSFVIVSDDLLNVEFRNRLYVGFDFSDSYYLAGVAAATEARRCIAFVAAWEWERNPNDAFNGFLLGVRRANATIPVHVVTLDNWFWPEAEERLVSLLVDDRGCDIVARYSDPQNLQRIVAQRVVSGGQKLFSVAPHSNLQEYYGDSVLTAIFTDWSKILVPILRDVALNGRVSHSGVPHNHGLRGDVVRLSALSSLASLAGYTAFTAAHREILAAPTGGGGIFCGTLRFRDGSRISGGNASNGCFTTAQQLAMKEFLEDRNTIYHPKFTFETTCPAGTSFRYSTSGNLTLSCLPCPRGTFSVAAGSANCTACPPGSSTTSDGATECVAIAVDEDALGRTGIIIVASCCAFILLVAFCAIAYLRYLASKKNRYAPRAAPLCIIFTDVESSTELWQRHPEQMVVAMRLHDRIIREVVERNGAYEVKNGGDGLMIACATITDAVYVATEIQMDLQRASWPSAFSAAAQVKEAAAAAAASAAGTVGGAATNGGNSLANTSSNLELHSSGDDDRIMNPIRGRHSGASAAFSPSTSPPPPPPQPAAATTTTTSTSASAIAKAAVINGLRVRIGIHLCMPQDVVVKYEPIRQYFDYNGKSISVAARIESTARGGQILIDHDSLLALRQDEEFQATLSADVLISLFARNVALKGLSTPYTLYSIVPVPLGTRTFDPLPGHEHDALLENNDADIVESLLMHASGGDEQRLLPGSGSGGGLGPSPNANNSGSGGGGRKVGGGPNQPHHSHHSHHRTVAGSAVRIDRTNTMQHVIQVQSLAPRGVDADIMSLSSSRVDESVSNAMQAVLAALPPAELAHTMSRLFQVHGLRKRGSNTKRLVRQLVMHVDGRGLSSMMGTTDAGEGSVSTVELTD